MFWLLENTEERSYTAVALKTGQRIRPTREGNSGFQTELSIEVQNISHCIFDKFSLGLTGYIRPVTPLLWVK